MNDIELQISMLGQVNYAEAVKRYGQEFAETVIAHELQLYADNLDCFDEYSTYDWMQEYLA